MKSICEAVIQKPVFEKTATYKMSRNTSKWNDEILQQFYEQVPYMPKDLGSEVVVNAMDDKLGYAKGSIVVWNGERKVNFPVIIKDFELSPFDVIITKDPGSNEFIYMPSSEDNLKLCLSSQKMANLQNRFDVGRYAFSDVKEPGGVQPKFPINIDDAPIDLVYPPFSKMSSLEDIEKFASQLESMPDVAANFIDNTQDLAANIVNLRDDKTDARATKHQTGVIDINDVVKAKQTTTLIDSQMFDVNKMVPVIGPAAAELRLFAYPSMEDFMESGTMASAKFDAMKTGKPVVGIVIDYKREYNIGKNNSDDCCVVAPASNSSMTPDQELQAKKDARTQRDQIFVSLDGKMYSTYSDYSKSGIGFYGSRILNQTGIIEKVLDVIKDKGYSRFTNSNKENKNDGSDKSFSPVPEMAQGKGDRDRYGACCPSSCNGGDLLIVYGAGDSYEAVTISGKFKKMMFNDAALYVGQDKAVVPANVAGVQKVSNVKTPVYKMMLDGVRDIYLIPETAIVLNMNMMKSIDRDEFLSPSRPVRKAFEVAEIMKVALCVFGDGYGIAGKAFEPLKKIAGIQGSMSTNHTLAALMTMGMEKTAAVEAMKLAVNRAGSEDPIVTIYGVRDDYVVPNPYAEIEKTASRRETLRKIAHALRRNLVKEASALTDPAAVDVVLSLNFINEDSLGTYIEQVGELRKVLGNLCELLVASRMGLSEIDESALKKCIEGLDETIKGLDRVKMAVKQ